MSLRYWTGLLFAAAGAWLVASALAQRARVGRARAAGGDRAPAVRPQVAAMGEIVLPLAYLGLAFAAAKAAMAYAMLGGGRVLSPLDLAGFVVALAGYGAWLTVKVKFPETTAAPARARPAIVPAAAPATAADERGGHPGHVVELDGARGAPAGLRRPAGVPDLGARVASPGRAA